MASFDSLILREQRKFKKKGIQFDTSSSQLDGCREKRENNMWNFWDSAVDARDEILIDWQKSETYGYMD